VGKTKKKVKNGLGGGADTAELFTIEQLTEISQNQDPVANDLAGDVAALIPEMKKGGIVTKNQITAFLANVCQETDHLNTLEEYGDEAYFRSFLGNEWVYHGRGYIMNTWRAAYQRLSSVLGVDLVSNPDLLARRKDLAAKAAVWYWTTNDIGPVADRGDFRGVCSLINRGENPPQGPINGWDERLAAYERAKAVIGTGTKPLTEAVGDPVTGPANETDASATTTEPTMLTAVEGTKFYEGLQYIKPAIGRTRYVFWQGGDVPARGPAWAINLPVPRIDEVISEGIFCAGVSNLFLRKVGKRVPIRNGFEQFDGGIAAYFGDNIYGPGYFEGYMEPFDLQKAKRWAEETRSGVLLGRKFVWNSISQVASEGHAAILLPSGYVLQAYPAKGLNWEHTIEESHDGGYYQVMVHPSNWIDYDGDEF
jgi:predicted chitinase